MLKRGFFGLLGLGAGVALGIYTVRKLERAQQRLSPEGLAEAAGSRAGALGGRLTEALEVGRAAAAAKEAELRATYLGGQQRPDQG